MTVAQRIITPRVELLRVAVYLMRLEAKLCEVEGDRGAGVEGKG